MVGPTLGPTFGGWITDTLSWPWIFYINLPFGMLAFALTLSYVRDSRFARRVGSVDWLGLLLLAIGIGAFQTMLERGERLDWFSSRQIVALAVGSVVALVWLILHELRTEHPVIDLRILREPGFGPGVAFAMVLGACLYATVFVLPVYLQQIRGFSANQTGLVILPGALASAFTMAFVGRLQMRMDPRLLITTGAGLFSFAMWQWSHFTTESGYGDFFWPLITRGVGLGLVFVPLTNLAISGLPMAKIPAGTGLYNLMRQLGGSVGIALGATLVQNFTTRARAPLAENVSRYVEVASERFAALTRTMVARGTPPALAEQKALRLLDLIVSRQATMLAFERIFLLFGMVFLLSLPLLLFMRRRSAAAVSGAAH
jgi:DHA2 family multidrug resistance protein